MENILTPIQGVLLFVGFGSTMLLLAMLNKLGHKNSVIEFLLANRQIGVFIGAMSATISWIWAPILFVSAQKAYQQGLAGLLSFAIPNALALVVFAFVAVKVRKALPQGFTLPNFMQQKHGEKVHALYLIQFLGLQVVAFAIQVLAGATLVSIMTGLSFHFVALLLVGAVFAYAVIGGLRASIITDVLQMSLLVGGIALIIPFTIHEAGGFNTVVNGLGGLSGFENAPWVLYSFGIPATIALLAGPMGDQMHWQRAFAFKDAKTVKRAYILASFFLIAIILGLSTLGFIAATHVDSITITSAQMVGPTIVGHFLPTSALVLFSIMLLSGLCSTLDSALCAVSSIVVVDLAKNKWQDKKVLIGRLSMLVTALCGMALAFIPKVEILHLFLLAGTLRAATFIPSIITVFNKNLSSKRVFIAILSSLILGSPVYVIGTLIGNPHMVVLGSLMPVILGVGICLLWQKSIEFLKYAKA